MRTLTIGGNDYKIEYSFEAAEYKDCVDKAFKILSGGYLMRRNGIPDDDSPVAERKREMAAAFVDGTGDMLSDIPKIAVTFLYGGLLENNPVASEAEAKELFKQFVKENPNDERASFFGMYAFLRDCMEEDGFFKLTGLEKMIAEMNAATEGHEEGENKPKPVKAPADRRRKSTSTK